MASGYNSTVADGSNNTASYDFATVAPASIPWSQLLK
jgi:hypothetical protein